MQSIPSAKVCIRQRKFHPTINQSNHKQSSCLINSCSCSGSPLPLSYLDNILLQDYLPLLFFLTCVQFSIAPLLSRLTCVQTTQQCGHTGQGHQSKRGRPYDTHICSSFVHSAKKIHVLWLSCSTYTYLCSSIHPLLFNYVELLLFNNYLCSRTCVQPTYWCSGKGRDNIPYRYPTCVQRNEQHFQSHYCNTINFLLLSPHLLFLSQCVHACIGNNLLNTTLTPFLFNNLLQQKEPRFIPLVYHRRKDPLIHISSSFNLPQ